MSADAREPDAVRRFAALALAELTARAERSAARCGEIAARLPAAEASEELARAASTLERDGWLFGLFARELGGDLLFERRDPRGLAHALALASEMLGGDDARAPVESADARRVPDLRTDIGAKGDVGAKGGVARGDEPARGAGFARSDRLTPGDELALGACVALAALAHAAGRAGATWAFEPAGPDGAAGFVLRPRRALLATLVAASRRITGSRLEADSERARLVLPPGVFAGS